MKKIIFPVIFISFLFSGIQLAAQTPWYIGGNAIAGASTFGSTTAQPVVFISSGTERGRLQASGNWSFGTSASVDRVQINSTGTANPLRVMFGGATKLLVHTGGGVAVGASVVPPANGLFVATRIGIATATPAVALDARGSTVFGQFKSSAGPAGVILDKSATNQNEFVLHRTAGADRWTEGTVGDDNFSLRNSSLGTNALTVDITNNDIGVGALAPDTKLNVVGSTSAGAGISTSGYAVGIQATSSSNTSVAVYGSAPTGFYGFYGSSNYTGVYGAGNSYGVLGSGGTYGVFGSGTTYGVYGQGGTYGVYASSTVAGGDGVHSNVSGASNYGVNSYSANSIGVYGATGNGSSYAGYFAGNVFTTGAYLPSDAKLKKNITSVDDAMSIINRLQPKNYEYRNDENFAKMNLPNGQHYGFIVQDLEKVLPNLVKETSFDLGKTVQQAEVPPIAPLVNGTPPAKPQPVPPIKEIKGEKIDFKAINYTELIPIVVKAMQEQDVKMKAQDIEIANLKSEINELRALIVKNANGSIASKAAGYLKQNSPNPPLSGNTVIKYFAPNDAMSAQILVTDMKGSILKTYRVTNGEGQLTIGTGELPSGTYNYTLYVNNSKIDTKQMVIAR